MQTNNLNLTLLSLNQSKKEVTINEALVLIDGILNTCLMGINVEKPIANPQNGDLYSIGSEPKDEWSNHAGKLAFWYFNSWHYITPRLGLIMWSKSHNKICVYNGVSWSLAR